MPSQTNFAFSSITPVAPDGNRNAVPQVGGTDPALFSFYSPNVGGIDARTGTSEAVLAAALGKLLTFTNGSAVAASVPHATTLAAWFWFAAKNLGAGSVTFTPTTSTIDGGATLVLATGDWALIFSDGTNFRSVKFTSSGAGGGTTWYEGAGAPSTLHNNGDFYLNTSNGDVYEQISGSWGSPIMNLTGPTGSTGSTGSAGPAPSGTGVVRVAAGVLENPATIAVSTDNTLGGGSPSDLKLSTEKAVKNYVDGFAPGGSGALTLKTNGVTDPTQTLLDLLNGLGILITDDGSGHTTVAASGFAHGGDGSDNAVTFDGTSTVLGLAPTLGVYTLNRDIQVTNMTVNATDGSGHTVTIITNNWIIYGTGTLTNNGIIHNNGAAGSNGGNSASSAGGSAGGTTVAAGDNNAHFPRLLPSTGLAGVAGGAGGATTGTQATAAGSASNASAAIGSGGASGSTGPSGGKGGTGPSGAGGAVRTGGVGGTVSLVANVSGHNSLAAQSFWFRNILGNLAVWTQSNAGMGVSPGGGGGGGDGTNAGGGGGGSGGIAGGGGVVSLCFRQIINNGTISSNGGRGGNGGNGRTQTVGNVGGGGGGAAGSGGAGGIVFLVYQKLTNSGTVQAAGGTGGTGGTKGSPHGTGTDDATNGADGLSGPSGDVIQIQC